MATPTTDGATRTGRGLRVALGLLLVVAFLLDTPRPHPGRIPHRPGGTGWFSSLGREVHLGLQGTVRVPFPAGPAAVRAAVVAQAVAVSRALEARGLGFPVDPAGLAVDASPATPVSAGDVRVRYAADLGFVAIPLPMVAGAADPSRWAGLALTVAVPDGDGVDGAAVRVAVRDAGLASASDAPDVRGLAAGGTLRVVAAFGQMDQDTALPDDQGVWSLARLRSALAARGFRVEAAGPDGGAVAVRDVCARLSVRVELVPPSRMPLADRDATAAVLVDAARRGDVVYFNGHSTQPALDVLRDPATWVGRPAQLWVLDSCWTLDGLAPAILQAAGPAVRVVSNADRSYVGSVDSFVALFDDVLDAAAADRCRTGVAPVSWASIVDRMNVLAVARAHARLAEHPDTRRRGFEVYGVSGGAPGAARDRIAGTPPRAGGILVAGRPLPAEATP